ncbi:ArsR/SmtB family transcription factor [Streptococcus sp. S784/96/1]|uniref:ArsR/SmtB family transcription factor n=1 Tax=Streptococcus sp. S784/96/1 TaxID=2653499 RepID=UPI00138692F0|nr:winged helix-turn-helix domain-containing protein [Streptococcus sp. S784/96/1]
MDIFISKHQSKIMDFLWLPSISYFDPSQIDLTFEERQTFQEVFNDFETLKKILEPYTARLHKFYRGVNHGHIIDSIYRYLLEEGHDPKTMEELYPLVLAISEEKIRSLLLNLIAPEGQVIETEEDLLNLLEDDMIKESTKWRVFWSYHHPKETVEGMVDLYKELIPLYQPFYEKYEKEVLETINRLDIMELFSDSIFDIKKYLSKSQKSTLKAFVTSPLHLNHIITTDELDLEKPVYVYTYARAEVILKGRQQNNLSKDTLDLAIKSLADPIRYDILNIVSHSTLKNKEIAAQLGITPANVSFHIQKLLNAGLLSFAIDKDEARYRLNKAFMAQCLNKIKSDFDL